MKSDAAPPPRSPVGCTPSRPAGQRRSALSGIRLGLCLLMSCWVGTAVAQAAAGATAFRIGPGDVLSVHVWKQPNLSLQLPVLPDGSLRYPLAGEVQVQGRSLAEIEKLLSDRIGENLREAVVSVTVTQVNSHRIYLLGEVLRPGEYPLRGPISLVQSLALASGLTPFAKRDSIVIVRRQGGVETRRAFDLDAYLRDPAGVDPPLQPGDTVIVR